MLFLWSRREGDANGCQQEDSGAQPEGHLVVAQPIIEPACGQRSESRAHRHGDALHRGDRAIRPTSEVVGHHRGPQGREGPIGGPVDHHVEDEPDRRGRLYQHDDAHGLRHHAQREQLLGADAAAEHVEDIAAWETGESEHPRERRGEDRIGAATDHEGDLVNEHDGASQHHQRERGGEHPEDRAPERLRERCSWQRRTRLYGRSGLPADVGPK